MAKKNINIEIKKILKEYEFIINTDANNEIKILINELLEKCKIEEDLKKLRKQIVKILSEYIKNQINRKDFSSLIILWEKLPNLDGKVQKYLNKLTQLKITKDPDIYMVLLTTIPALSIECEKILKLKKKTVDNEEINTLIQFYCVLNDIDLEIEKTSTEADYKIDLKNEELYDDLDKEFIMRIMQIPLLDRYDEYKLLELCHEGDIEARNKLINHNLRLVYSRVKNRIINGMSFMDLFQEGVLGLIHAIEKYDLERKCKLSTYAVPWIDRYCKTALAEKSTVIKKSKYDQENIQKFSNAELDLTIKFGREVTYDETADYLKLSQRKRKLLKAIRQEIETLDKPAYDETEETIGDYIKDQVFVAPEDMAMHIILKDEIKNQINKLTEKERYVICLRFGLLDGRCYTLKEVGKRMDVSFEYVRQVEAKAKTKLRTSQMRKLLDDYYG